MIVQDKKVWCVFGYGDFDMPYLIGIGTDEEEARKILDRYCKRWDYKIVNLGKNKFRNTSIHSEESNEVDYYFKKIKLNTFYEGI